MPRIVGTRAQAMLDLLPPYLAVDPNMIGVCIAVGNEIELLQQSGLDFAHKFFPANADDDFNTLGIWESLLGLPVMPPGISVEKRRAAVVSHFRARSVAEGKEWVARLSEALGVGWTHEEGPGPYQITIRFPYAAGGYTPEVAVAFARAITPAHIDIVATFSEGFLIGISQVGDGL